MFCTCTNAMRLSNLLKLLYNSLTCTIHVHVCGIKGIHEQCMYMYMYMYMCFIYLCRSMYMYM